MKKIALMLFTAALVCSCNMESGVPLYSEISMGYMITPMEFKTDGGNIYQLTSDSNGGDASKPISSGRIVGAFEVQKELSKGVYQTKMTAWTTVEVKSALTSSQVTPEDHVGTDDIAILTGWCSGGYINLQTFYNIPKAEPATKHYINLVLDEEKSSPDEYVFILSHDAQGDVYKESTVPTGYYSWLSFDPFDVLPIGVGNFSFRILINEETGITGNFTK